MWHFTFGQGSPLRNHYASVALDDYDDAREAMVSAFGSKWAFQYDDEAIKEVIERWGIQRLCLIRAHPVHGQWTVMSPEEEALYEFSGI